MFIVLWIGEHVELNSLETEKKKKNKRVHVYTQKTTTWSVVLFSYIVLKIAECTETPRFY